MKQEEVITTAANRRTFLKGAGLTGLSLAAAGMVTTEFAGQRAEAATTYNDVDILNFALNLEYFEAEYYAMATYGATLVQLGVITSAQQTGPTTGGKAISGFATLPEAYLASALRSDEIEHVMYLRKALGSAAVKKPAINLDALGYGFGNIDEFLKITRQFEDVGISAYLGAAPLITSKAYLAAAAAIMATEAQHASAIRTVCIRNGVTSPAVDSLDVPPSPNLPFNTDNNGLSIPRTIRQVLNIVYQGTGCSGGFFPAGLNGNIAC